MPTGANLAYGARATSRCALTAVRYTRARAWSLHAMMLVVVPYRFLAYTSADGRLSSQTDRIQTIEPYVCPEKDA
jgi:hypothetical protein